MSFVSWDDEAGDIRREQERDARDDMKRVRCNSCGRDFLTNESDETLCQDCIAWGDE